MNYESWLTSVPTEITSDSLWKMEAYRLALFFVDLCWFDVSKLVGDKRTLDMAGQLYRAAGSVEANISEGYSRGTGRDRARFYEYALGSARETRGRYYKGCHVLGQAITAHRLNLITQIVRLLLTTVPNQRNTTSFLREVSPEYRVKALPLAGRVPPAERATEVFKTVPMP